MTNLDKIKQKSELMSILLTKSAKHYAKIKNILQFPLVFTTAALVVINAYENDKPNMVKMLNVIINSSNMVLMGILKSYNVTEKIENHNTRASEYLDLAHKIDTELSADKYNQNKINQYQNLFDVLTKSTLVSAIPNNIIKEIKNTHPNISLPLCLGELSSSTTSSPNQSPETYTLSSSNEEIV